jgi:type I restriction enzyme S subunit
MENNNQLPKDWKCVKLEDICIIISGKNQSKVINPQGKYPIYGSSGIFGYADEYLCNEGTTVIGRKGTINRPLFVNTKFWNVDTAFGLSPNENYDNKLLYYFCLSFNFHKLDKSTTIPSLARRDLLTINIPLPPKPTQLAIVSKIEELFSEIENGIKSLFTAKEQLKKYRQSVLKWAFEGKLSVNYDLNDEMNTMMKKDKNHNPSQNQNNHGSDKGELPEGWKWVKIGDVCKCIVPNRDKPKSFTGNIKWITTPNLNENSIRLNYENVKLGLSEIETKEYNARIIPIDSVIMTCVGTFGLSAIVEKPIVINQQLHAFITNGKVNPKYLAYCIQFNKYYFESKSTSTTIQYLNKTNCNSMPFPLCSIEEQVYIVEQIESRLSVADKMEESITESLQQAEALRQSILKKAFEGKLI